VRIVLDPNVLISAALSSKGPSAQILAEARDASFELVACPALIDELARVLRRERFRSYLSIEDSIRYVEAVARLATSVANRRRFPRRRVTATMITSSPCSALLLTCSFPATRT